MPELASLYNKKDAAYFSDTRELLMNLIDRTGLRVLDVGCATGVVGKRLLETGKAKWVTGIELVPEQGEIARSVLNEIHVGNIEEMSFCWPSGQFDCFVLGDVLEHVIDPWNLLKRLRPFLADDGIVVASVPNVRHWPIISNLLLHGDWQYTQSGVLDITHLRFFTRKSIIRAFAENGYSAQTIQPLFNGRRYSIPHRFTFGLLTGLLCAEWLIRLKKA